MQAPLMSDEVTRIYDLMETRDRIMGHWFAIPDDQLPAGIYAAMVAAPGAPEDWESISGMLEAGIPSDDLPCAVWNEAKRAYARRMEG
jgi:hypothetical protein